MGRLDVRFLSAKLNVPRDEATLVYPFVKATLDGADEQQTSAAETCCPDWHTDVLKFNTASDSSRALQVSVFDKDLMGDDKLMVSTTIDVTGLTRGVVKTVRVTSAELSGPATGAGPAGDSELVVHLVAYEFGAQPADGQGNNMPLLAANASTAIVPSQPTSARNDNNGSTSNNNSTPTTAAATVAGGGAAASRPLHADAATGSVAAALGGGGGGGGGAASSVAIGGGAAATSTTLNQPQQQQQGSGQMTDAFVASARRAFGIFDVSGDGQLDRIEMTACLLSYLPSASAITIRNRTIAADTNRDGLISFDEFLRIAHDLGVQ